MNQQEKDLELAPPPQIYLMMDLSLTDTPAEDIQSIAKTINTTENTPFSSLLIKQTEGLSKCTPEFVAHVQKEDIAVIIEDNVPLVQSSGADGVHLSDDDEEIFEAAINTLSEDVIIGLSAKQSRHKAMIFAEQGCSYIAISDGLSGQTTQTSVENVDIEEFDRPPEIKWWVSLFSTPAVAWNISSLKQAITATKEGADFLALAPSYWQQGENSTEIIKDCLAKTSAIERYTPTL
jgi:thiamine monophosphate synthase